MLCESSDQVRYVLMFCKLTDTYTSDDNIINMHQIVHGGSYHTFWLGSVYGKTLTK